MISTRKTVLDDDNLNAADELLVRVRATTARFLATDVKPQKLTQDQQGMLSQIFNDFLHQSVQSVDEKTFHRWLTNDVQMDKASADVVQRQMASLPNGARVLFDLVQNAAQEDAQKTLDALNDFRQSYHVQTFLKSGSASESDAQRYLKLLESVAGSRFEPLIRCLENETTGFRAEMVARFSMYCESGYAAHDLEATMIRASADLKSDGLRALQAILPPAKPTTAQITDAIEARFNELFIPTQVKQHFAYGDGPEGGQELVYLAFPQAGTKFSFASGRVEGSGFVDAVIPYVNDPERLLAGTVTAMDIRDDRNASRQTPRHFGALAAAVARGSFKANSNGKDVTFKAVNYQAFMTPVFTDPVNNPRPSMLARAMQNDHQGMAAVTALQLFCEGNVARNDPQLSMDQVLKTSMRPLGAKSPWEGHPDLSASDRLLKACETTSVAIMALAKTLDQTPEEKHKNNHGRLFTNINSDGRHVLEALGDTLHGLRQSPHFEDQHQKALQKSRDDLVKLSSVMQFTDRNNMINNFEGPLVHHPASPVDIATAFRTMDRLWIERQQARSTFQTMGTDESKPFADFSVNGPLKFTPADLNTLPGSLDQIASSNSKEIRNFFTQKDVVQRLGPRGLRAVATLVQSSEGKEHLRALEIPVSGTEGQLLNDAVREMGVCWTRVEAMPDNQAALFKTEIARRMPMLLKQGMASLSSEFANAEFASLPARLGHAFRAIHQRGWLQKESPRKHKDLLGNRLLHLAMVCTDVEAVRDMCDLIGTSSLLTVQRLGRTTERMKDDPCFLPKVVQDPFENIQTVQDWVSNVRQFLNPTTGLDEKDVFEQAFGEKAQARKDMPKRRG